MNNIPFVSVIIPCRNEKNFIRKCLDSIVVQDYSKNRLEVLVVDGMSVDGTRAIIERYSQQYTFIRLLENSKKITPVALNIGIKYAKGEVIIRMDAHAEYPSHYVSTSIEYLNKIGVDVVGGPIITKPGAETLIARSIALATSHPFGVGNSIFRTSTKAGYVDTVPFGAYKREVFSKVGFFDEHLVRNQDNELSSRISKSGGKIYLTPDLAVHYYNQATVSGFLKQAFKTGMWNVVTLKINPSAFRWRHFIPFIFVTTVLLLIILAPLHTWVQFLLLGLVGLYGSAALFSSLQIGFRKGIKYAIILPMFFFLYHICYGLGTWAGLIKSMYNWLGNLIK